MPSIITNRERTMLDTLKNSLRQAERVDILTAFFYFSGFNALAEELKDKQIRILVGNTIEPAAIEELCKAVKEGSNESLDTYGVRRYASLNNSQKKENYINSFIDLFNKSSLSEQFDSTENQEIFKMFISKIKDGTLEIRLTAEQNHAKAFILTNKPEFSFNGDQKGVVITGSSNFTYNGLLGQGEMNERFSDNDKYDEYLEHFNSLWNASNSIDICVNNGNKDFEETLKKRLWIFATPKPYQVFVRILYELFSSVDKNVVKSPSEITNGKFFNLKYQIDAVKLGIDCIQKNNGVIIADVVGLGKSIIASAIAYNLDIRKTVIVAPPHLVEQWNEYQQEFGIRGVQIYSSGKIESLYEEHADDPDPILYIIDEAHRYRNELSSDYQMLHQLTRSNPTNKVILLTATPYNNRPQDLFALIKLFQTPSRSTINSVDNLGVRFHELIAIYNRLAKEGKRNFTKDIEMELTKLSDNLRVLIDPVIIRRSRIDLQEIREYAEDLRLQGIQFPTVVGPELVEYDLGDIREKYLDTLDKLSTQFNAARYNPSAYLIDIDAFNARYGSIFGEMDVRLFQGNLAEFIKRLLVMRFESSKAAFKKTLTSLLQSYENIKKWWAKGYVPIKKSGSLSDPDEDEIQETLDEIDNIDNEPIDIDKIKKKAIPFDKNLFKDDYIEAVESDIQLLTTIYEDWFGNNEANFDPKYDEVKSKLRELLSSNQRRKIVIFSSFSDTAEYVSERLSNDGFRSFLYTGSSSSRERIVVKQNFDASLKLEEQANDFDVIVATDALSEGFNLNRAGVIVNYDIPYNPTRVVQRIGRINRINKKMFDNLYIFNFFPTDIGEENTLIRGISTLKMFLINNIVGNDTRTLTPDESLKSYFLRQYREASSEENSRTWDVDYRNIYNGIKHNTQIIDECLSIPERARIVRKGQPESCSISFVKRGNNSLFALAMPEEANATIVPPDIALKYFKATIEEKGFECDSDLDTKFAIIRDEIKKPYPKVPIDKRKGQAIDKIQQLIVVCLAEKDYLSDLIATIQMYDDLSDGELKYLASIRIIPSKALDIVKEVKGRIPVHYIIQIKERAESIDAQTETIMFTEDLRHDND